MSLYIRGRYKISCQQSAEIQLVMPIMTIPREAPSNSFDSNWLVFEPVYKGETLDRTYLLWVQLDTVFGHADLVRTPLLQDLKLGYTFLNGSRVFGVLFALLTFYLQLVPSLYTLLSSFLYAGLSGQYVTTSLRSCYPAPDLPKGDQPPSPLWEEDIEACSKWNMVSGCLVMTSIRILLKVLTGFRNIRNLNLHWQMCHGIYTPWGQ